MKFPEECPILKEHNDQIYSCYINPFEKCLHFEECFFFLRNNTERKKLIENEYRMCRNGNR